MKLYFLIAIFFSGYCHAQIADSGLVAFYPFNNNTLDSSENHFDAIPGGCSFTFDRFGNENAALLMNGIDDSLIIPLEGFTPLGENFTIAFWMKTNSPEKLNILSLKEFASDTTNNFEIQFNSTSALQYILELYYGFYTYWNGSGWAGNNFEEGSAGRWYDGKWHHHALIRSNDTLQIWHDRELYYAEYLPGPMGDALDFIASAAPHRYKGALDDMVFYDRALQPAEVVNLFHDHNPYTFITPEKTDAYFEGDTVIVWWKWDPEQVSDSIDLEYRINETGDWLMTEQNHLVAYFNYPFVMDFSVGTKVELRITDKLNAANTQTVGPFIVSPYQWQLVSDTLPFTPRDGCGLVNYKGKMWLLGGWDPPYHEPNYTCSEIYSSIDGIEWEYHGEAPWPARHISGWLVHDSSIYLIGSDPQAGNLSDVWKSDDGINWIQLLDTIPDFIPARNSHMVCSVNNAILNFGGQPNEYTSENLNQVWRSADGTEWEQLPNAPWPPRGMVLNSCVAGDSTAWLLGGGRLWDRACYNDVWKTTDGVDWELVNDSAPWAPRYWHTVAWYDNNMWVLCGIVEQTNNAETWYSSDGITWYELKYPKYLDRHAASTTVYDNALWLMSGIGSNDSWKLVNTTPPIADNIAEHNIAIHMYPNPADTYLRVDCDVQSVQLIDITGRQIPLPFSEKIIDVSSIDPGIYVIAISASDNSIHYVSVVIL